MTSALKAAVAAGVPVRGVKISPEDNIEVVIGRSSSQYFSPPTETNGTTTSMAVIKLKYVNSFANRDRKNGRLRHYFRRRGEKAIPLPGVPGSATDAGLRDGAGRNSGCAQIGASRTLPGSINALVIDYYRSAEWLNGLAEDTRKTRRRIIERFRMEKHATSASRYSGASTSKRCWRKFPNCRSETSLAGSDPRTPAVRRTDYAQGRSYRRCCRYQVAQDERTPYVDRCRDRTIPCLLAARNATTACDGIRTGKQRHAVAKSFGWLTTRKERSHSYRTHSWQ